MQHDYHIRAFGKRLGVARLLVAAIAVIAIMHKMHQAEFARHLYGAVGAEVVHQYAYVDDLRQFFHCRVQRALRVVCGHHDCYFFPIQHLC